MASLFLRPDGQLQEACDVDGRCLAAFSMNLGICSITRAELRGVMTGLQIAWDRGFRRIIVQLDSRVAVQLLLGGWRGLPPTLF
ncbi:hypothetical protein LINPERHAP2_LOCUS42433 [Linum perenne]